MRRSDLRPALDGAIYVAGIYGAVFGLPLLVEQLRDPGSRLRLAASRVAEQVREARQFESSVRRDLDALVTLDQEGEAS
jgi:hypothetical protein